MIMILCLGAGVGCSRKEAPASPKAARVSATKAFENYFGTAPTTDKGTCFAFVIYFPSAREPGKVVPLPFFSFDETSLKRVALERLLGGMEEKAYAGEFLQPFPTGTRLRSISEQNGTVTADFSRELRPAAENAKGNRAIFNAVVLTLRQFSGVSAVRLTSEGRGLPAPEQAQPEERSVVLPPAAPRLLNVIAVKENHASPVKEVDALFDRPVEISRCEFSFVDGARLAGDVYQAMFDMAAVLKPKEPAKISAGSEVRVRWKVTDKLGRSAEGEGGFPLEVKVHEE